MTVATAGPAEKAPPKRRAEIDVPTLRQDRWWAQPLITATVLLTFIAYSTWAAFQNANYYARPYLSPFYSPCIAARCGYARAGSTVTHPPMVGMFGPGGRSHRRSSCSSCRLVSAYVLLLPQGVLPVDLLSPPACAVKEPHRRYSGETRLPLILQNVHRYFFYLGLILNCILT